ncbi:MAG TPA: TetR/AcrR family transcriptional regulator [Acidimicrobiia bacterium]|nr:TetR/AcrR family transcriptional regulator [Acidimicrobiia bacterium]
MPLDERAPSVERDDVDGRTARRDRNRIAVLDAVLELFSEGDLAPSAERVAQRSGVSLRSVYRYVADSEDLTRAAIERHLERVGHLFSIPAIGEGARDERIERFVAARLALYEAIAPTARASRLRAPTSAPIREQLERGRRLLRAQVERHFAPELDVLDDRVRSAVLAAIDALTQIETIDLYRVHGGHSSSETHELFVIAVARLLAHSAP